MLDRFDLEEEIQKVWNTEEDLDKVINKYEKADLLSVKFNQNLGQKTIQIVK